MRRILTSIVALAALAVPASIAAARAQDGEWVQASSLIGKPGYPPGFAHFNYVNPDAPKGGTARLSGASPTFDTLNPILPRGVPADGLGLVYETLMTRALDELRHLRAIPADRRGDAGAGRYLVGDLSPQSRCQMA